VVASWSAAPDASPPVDGEFRVWRIGLDRPAESVARLARLLDADERERAARFRFERDRMRFQVGRAALRTILGDILGVPPPEVRFAYGAHGKPELAPPWAASGLRFNVSHSDALALCAVSVHRRVGVDLERLRTLPDLEAIAARVFSPREQNALGRIPLPERQAAFFTAWTRKEAYVKALGEGFAHRLARFTVSLAPGTPARLEHVDDDPAEAGRWTLQALAPDPAYVAALAADGPVGRLVCATWREPGADGGR
jgi:4'-phosphopantetheinyl transferase